MPDRAGAAHTPHANRPAVYFRLSSSDALDALRRMHRIRRFEEAAEDFMFAACPTARCISRSGRRRRRWRLHAADRRDAITSTHRGHGHCIAKGATSGRCSPNSSARRPARARGAAVRCISPIPRGAISGLTASSVPGCRSRWARAQRQAAGRGRGGGGLLRRRRQQRGRVSRMLNLASIWKLPVVFVCENNQYAMSTAIARSTAVRDVADRAVAYACRRDRRRQRFRRGREACFRGGARARGDGRR